MELLQLQYFFESAKSESFAKTAEAHLVPTSSVSGAVRRLEGELGCKLFDRTANRIILNSNGKRMYESLEIIFNELKGAVSELSTDSEDTREIKMLVRAMRSDITNTIIEYKAKFPRAKFKISFDFTERDFEKYDIIIDERSNTYPKHESFELYRMKLCMTVHANSPLVTKHLHLKELESESFVSLGEQSNMHRILIKACKQAGFIPEIAILCNDIKCYERLIESGMGIGLERKRKDTARKIRYLNVMDFDEEYTVFAYYKQNAYYGNVGHFLDFLRNKSLS
ncbi:MAG: LysR family transcriptional regulator [Ruminococcaceae bacterium]|nr:LysR family transcriptional regulator [Oscillospiraceae bacterium]